MLEEPQFTTKSPAPIPSDRRPAPADDRSVKANEDTDAILYCDASIYYHDKSNNPHDYTARGENKHGDTEPISTFRHFGLNNLANVQKITNPPGQCAEPHAVANALKSVGKDNIQEINRIKVTAAKFIKRTLMTKPGSTLTYTSYGKDVVYRRCATCRQWIRGNWEQDGWVKNEYLTIAASPQPAAPKVLKPSPPPPPPKSGGASPWASLDTSKWLTK